MSPARSPLIPLRAPKEWVVSSSGILFLLAVASLPIALFFPAWIVATVLLTLLSLLHLYVGFHAAPPLWLRWIDTIGGELYALGRMGLFFFSPFFHPPLRRASSAGASPILLVHGYMVNSSPWNAIVAHLDKRGLGPIYTIDLGHPLGALEEHAETVRQAAEKIRQETGIPFLSLVGHSMGGLVAAHYALALAPPSSIRAVITVGSPLLGSRCARFVPGKNARQMEPGSPFLARLREGISRSAHLFTHIGSATDTLVIPAGSAYPDTGAARYQLDNGGHAMLYFHPAVASLIGSRLGPPQS